jgi:hypothetical protein
MVCGIVAWISRSESHRILSSAYIRDTHLWHTDPVWHVSLFDVSRYVRMRTKIVTSTQQ